MNSRVLPHFSQTEREFLSQLTPDTSDSRAPSWLTSPALSDRHRFRPLDHAASKFENRINYVHDVAVVCHNHRCALPL